MQTGNEKNTDRFDKFLKESLKQYRPQVPADFPQRMLSRLEQSRQQEALRKVVRQERALLAAFILLPIAGVILVLMFPNVLLILSQLYENIILVVQHTTNSMVQSWQLWAIYTAIAAFLLYAAYEVLLADN